MSDEVTEFPTKLNALPPDVRSEKREKLKARKVFASAFSPFVRAMRECMHAYLTARAQGVERADAVKGIEEVLRSSWGKSATKFPPRCDACEDTGYEERICRPYARCERDNCQRKGEEHQHFYVTPCACEKGERFRPKTYVPAEAAATIGQVRKRKSSWSHV